MDPRLEDTALIRATPLKLLRVLVLEDNKTDALLVEEELRRGHINFTATRVATRDQFIRQLGASEFDLILADYKLPDFDGMSALAVAQEMCPYVPFILVSGQISEEMALEAVNGGATDYVFKDNLVRLVPSVHRALREVRERNVRRKAQEALKLSEQRYRLLVAHAHDAILQMDREGHVVFANPATRAIFGYDPAELVCDPGLIERIIQPTHRRQYGHVRDEFKSEGILTEGTAEWAWTRKDGQPVYTESTFTNLVDDGGQVIGYQVIIRDNTKQMEAPVELRESEEKPPKLSADLELRVQERTAQLEAANKELEAFNYTVSHDLRAPLRAIKHIAGSLLEQPAGALSAEVGGQVHSIRANAERMVRLIDDLLAFSGSARREFHLSQFDMGELARAVFDEFRNAHPERRLEFEVKELPPATGDLSMLREAMANLISNAVKFTRTRQVARIEMGGWADNGGAQHVYYVRDNGIGFDPAYTDKLFDVFQRLHSAEDFEGTGVGLAIVRRIIERHGGRVWAEGEAGQGATFYFSLPTRQA